MEQFQADVGDGDKEVLMISSGELLVKGRDRAVGACMPGVGGVGTGFKLGWGG